MQLVVWTNMGRSLMFEDVKNFSFHSQGFEFDYLGGSTGVHRHANFNNTCVAGYAFPEQVSSSSK